MDSFTRFNFIEGSVWIVFSAISWIASDLVPKHYRRFAWIAALTFVLFGISDLLEIRTGAFFLTPWLFALKIICVATLAALVVWYIRLRAQSI
ncbi:hypothetical protein C4552_03175 [Candidatus Parcubacteria bacterium]|nr:MAG: hypothetical protein C4552_03175 [Candidatus Parcubacteria bacterium]